MYLIKWPAKLSSASCQCCYSGSQWGDYLLSPLKESRLLPSWSCPHPFLSSGRYLRGRHGNSGASVVLVITSYGEFDPVNKRTSWETKSVKYTIFKLLVSNIKTWRRFVLPLSDITIHTLYRKNTKLLHNYSVWTNKCDVHSITNFPVKSRAWWVHHYRSYHWQRTDGDYIV